MVFPTEADRMVSAALWVLLLSAGFAVVGVALAWFLRQRRVVVTAVVAAMVLPLAAVTYSVGTELRRELDEYSGQGVHRHHPAPK